MLGATWRQSGGSCHHHPDVLVLIRVVLLRVVLVLLICPRRPQTSIAAAWQTEGEEGEVARQAVPTQAVPTTTFAVAEHAGAG